MSTDSPYRPPEDSTPPESPFTLPLREEEASEFRDLSGLTNLLRGILLVYAILAVLCLWGNRDEQAYLDTLQDGGFATQAEADEAWTRIDDQAMWLSLARWALIVGLAILSSVWTYRASENLRALGAEYMVFTPGWAVGWFFIPVANLVYGYLVMREIYQASAEPTSWQSLRVNPKIKLWWSLRVALGLLSWVILGWSFAEVDLDLAYTLNTLDFFAILLAASGALVETEVYGTIWSCQDASYDREESDEAE